MYLVLFSIVLYRTIDTVYTDNIFLHKLPMANASNNSSFTGGVFYPSPR